jgi:hypothetical protein
MKLHFKICVLSCLFFSYSLYAIIYDAIINLGGDCQVAYQLKKNNLRSCALPFDLLITPFDSLRKLLEHNFDQFLAKNNLAFITGPDKYIIDTQYGVRLIHDFKLSEEFLQDYDTIHDRYARRVKRFYDIIQTNYKIVFIRKNITKQQAQELSTLIHTLFPHLEYTILALATTEEIKQPWDIPHVQNYYLRQKEPYTWKGDDTAWQEILSNIEIKPDKQQTED